MKLAIRPSSPPWGCAARPFETTTRARVHPRAVRPPPPAIDRHEGAGCSRRQVAPGAHTPRVQSAILTRLSNEERIPEFNGSIRRPPCPPPKGIGPRDLREIKPKIFDIRPNTL